MKTLPTYPSCELFRTATCRKQVWKTIFGLALSSLMALSSVKAQIQTAGNLYVNLDATTLPLGAVSDITNSGTLGGYFETRPGGTLIGTTNGVNGVQFLGTNYMVLVNGIGGALIPPPSGLVGSNATASIEVWAYNPSVADDECMVAWGRRGTTGQNMAFEYGYNAGLGAVTHTGTANDIGWDNFGGTPLNNRWHHLAYTYDGTNESVYVDGALANSKAVTLNIATNAGISLAGQWTNSGTVISTAPALATLGIARVRIHDGALTPAQVLANFNTEKATFISAPPTAQFLTSGPTHRYSFNEPATNDATGLSIHDSAGTADGVVQGLSGMQTVGQYANGRLMLPGGPQNTTAYADFPNGLLSVNSTNNGGSGEVSIEVWFKNTGGQSLSWARVFDFGSVGTNDVPGMELTGPGGYPAAGATGPDTLYYSAQMGTGINQRRLGWQNRDPLPTGSTTNGGTSGDVFMMNSFQTDRHVVVTWQESTGQIIAYENGTRVAGVFATNSISAINDVNLWLGRSQGGVGDGGLAGEFDEFRIYNKVLTPGQVVGNFQAGPDTINTGEQTPSIVAQPQNATIMQGSAISFNVLASGSPAVSYQWRRNGTPIAGATDKLFTLAVASMANNGDLYSCVISNFAGATPHTVTSANATLTVIPNQALPAQFLHETRDGNRDNYNTASSGIVGGLFTSGNTPVPVTHLGFYDMNKDGLNRDHHVGIFSADASTLLCSVTVPAGTSALLTNGYRWVALDTPFMLSPNTTYILEAEVFNGDGDGWPDVFIPGQWNSYFVGTNGPATRQGRFSGGAWPSAPVSTSSQNGTYGAPNLATLPVGPLIASMLQTSVTQYANLSVTIPAIVNGDGPVTAQWYKAPGTLLVGQTNASLVLSAVTAADAGDYYVIASNAGGTAQSATATLTVLADTPVSFAQQPVSISVPENYPASFTVAATGTPPIAYQWARNGTPIAGATNTIYSIAAVSSTNNGDAYSCVVSNFANSSPHVITSSTATLTVQPNKAPTMQVLYSSRTPNRDDYTGSVGGQFPVGPTDALVTHLGFADSDGDGLNRDHHVGIFSITGTLLASVIVPAGADAYYTNGYRWVALNPPFVLTNNTTYVLLGEVFSGDGDVWPDVFSPTNWNPYFVGTGDASQRIGRFVGSAWPAPATSGGTANTIYAAPNMAVLPVGLPQISMLQSNVTVYVGDSTTFSSIANGQAPLTLQWYKAPNTPLSGQTNTSLTLNNLTQANSGTYYIIGTDPLGTAQSSSVTLSVLANTPPIINQQPVSQSVYLHQRATFSVSAVGQQPLSYQWKFNGAPIAGANGSSFTVMNPTTANAGNYSVTISNSLGTTNSASASLAVTTLPDGSYASAVLNANPVIYYRFNEAGTDTNVAFNLGNLGVAGNGTYEGSFVGSSGPLPPDFANFDNPNPAPVFDGLSTDVLAPALNFDTNAPVSVTMAAWINKPLAQEPYAGIIFYRGLAGANGFGIKQDPTSGADVLEYHWNNTYFNFASGVGVPDAQWLLVALIVQPNQAILYLHDSTGTVMGTNVAPHTAVAFSDSATHVGWDTAGTASSPRRFYGQIDEAMIFDRALAPAELDALYSAASAPQVKISATLSGSNLILNWATGTLQQANEAAGPYSDVAGATSPYSVSASAARKFYRVRVQ
jgi:Concanavalin A-like lectin/glucanases superfamily/Immunoglobulin domain/Immunoglobulin I-set domain